MNLPSLLKSLIKYIAPDEVSQEVKECYDLLKESKECYALAQSSLTQEIIKKNKGMLALVTQVYGGIEGTVSSADKNNFISFTLLKLNNLEINLERLEELLDQSIDGGVIKESLTARNLNMIELLKYIRFIAVFSVELLNFLYFIKSDSVNENVTKDKQQSIHKNVMTYGKLLGLLGCDKQDFDKTLLSIPDVKITTENLEIILDTYNDKQLIPFSYSIRNDFIGNPFLEIQKIRAQRNANIYKALVERKNLLKLQKVNLELELQDNKNPTVEHEIIRVATIIKKLDSSIKDIEDEVGFND